MGPPGDQGPSTVGVFRHADGSGIGMGFVTFLVRICRPTSHLWKNREPPPPTVNNPPPPPAVFNECVVQRTLLFRLLWPTKHGQSTTNEPTGESCSMESAVGAAKHCCICIPGRACVERSLTCVPPLPQEHVRCVADRGPHMRAHPKIRANQHGTPHVRHDQAWNVTNA